MSEGPGYGYQIARQLEDEWSPAAVYQALKRLREQRLIEPTQAEDGDRRKHYRVTSAGVELNARRIARSLDLRHDTISALLRAPATNISVAVDELERRLLSDLRSEPVRHSDLHSELAWAERRLVNDALLRWIGLVREKVGDAALD